MGLSRGKRAAFAGVGIGLGVGMALALTEAGLHSYERWDEGRQAEPLANLAMLEPNPAGTGSYRLKPNLDLVTRVDTYRVHIRTNSHGMHWREIPLRKRGRIRRIAFLGDSFTFGCWADRFENSFAGVFERNVSTERFEVLNFGVGGYGIGDMELLLVEKVMSFSPDYVFLMLFNGNDFRDTYLGIDKASIVDGTAILDPEAFERKVPEEYRVCGPNDSPPAPDKTAVGRRLAGWATYRFLAPHLGLENHAVAFRVSPRCFTNFTFWSQYPYPQIARRAMDDSLATIERIRVYLLSRGVRLALATIPVRDQVYGDREEGPDFDIDFPQMYVKIYAGKRGVPFLDLLPPLRERVQETNERLYTRSDIHFNNKGHEVVGQLLADWFRCCVKLSPLSREDEAE